LGPPLTKACNAELGMGGAAPAVLDARRPA
jgi:hypothetical protein